MNRLSGVLSLAEKGYKFFPLRDSGTIQEQKRPAIKAWQTWATNDRDKLLQHPNTNWGLFCDHDLFIIDLDEKVKEGRKQNGIAQWEQLQQEHFPAPTTLTIRTPSGGLQLYYQGNGQSTVGKLAPDIDTRGRGGYVVALGSVLHNEDGSVFGRYEIETDAPIAPAPKWLLTLTAQSSKEPLERPADHDVPGSIGEGNRDTELTRWAGLLRGQGLTANELEIALLAVNHNRCSPPLEDDQVIKIARSIGAKPRGIAEAIADFARTPEDIREELSVSAPKQIGEYRGDTPEREWVVKDWIPKGEITSIYGGGSVGKSLLSLQLAIGVGTGGKWLGLDCAKMPVLYVACEDDDQELHLRRDNILAGTEYLFEREKILESPVYLWSRVGRENDIAVEKDSDVVPGRFLPVLEGELGKLVESQGKTGVFLILDTVSDVYLGSENVREKVNKFVKTILGKLRLDHNVTILLLAHPSRTGQNTGDILSGSTAWDNAVRSRIIAVRHETMEDCITVTRAKSNYARVGDKVVLRYESGRFVTTELPADADEMDVLLALSHVLETDADRLSVKQAATWIRESGEVSHLFHGASTQTVARKIIVSLQEPKEYGGALYQIVEEPHGKRTYHYVKSSKSSRDA